MAEINEVLLQGLGCLTTKKKYHKFKIQSIKLILSYQAYSYYYSLNQFKGTDTISHYLLYPAKYVLKLVLNSFEFRQKQECHNKTHDLNQP